MDRGNGKRHQLLIVQAPGAQREEILSLLMADYGIGLATDCEQALALVASENFELALIEMDQSGIESCRRLRTDARGKHLPVIALLPQADRESIARAYDCGAADYAHLPVLERELRDRIGTRLELLSREQRLRRLLAMRELMMSTLSHDLRGPIGTMAAMMELMIKGPVGPDRSEKMLQNLASSARRCFELLEDLLTWSRAVTQELPFHPMPLPLRALCEECLDSQRAAAAEKELRLEIEIPAEARMHADPNLVRTILDELITNAVKFTPAGGRITLGFEAAPEWVALEVSDSGVGLPANLIEQLDRNQPLASSPGTQGEKGTGLGLKICQEFAARHGGYLEFRRRDQGGSCFALVLPQDDSVSASRA